MINTQTHTHVFKQAKFEIHIQSFNQWHQSHPINGVYNKRGKNKHVCDWK